MDARLRRLLSRWAPDFPDVRFAPAGAELIGPTLETLPADLESPRLVSPEWVEGGGLEPRQVRSGTPGFAAFLDGIQRSLVIGHVDGVPLVAGTVAAVIRRRIGRRLMTDRRGAAVRRRVYMPRQVVPAALWDAAEREGYAPCDSGAEGTAAAAAGPHPLAVVERAYHLVQQDRERLEQQLGEEWCADESAPLYIDGGISKSERVATAWCAVGVVKSHRTLYADAAAVATLARLEAGERTTAFRVTSQRRTSVLSWYLRLREPAGRGPLWGLVRIEVADATSDAAAIAARAEEVSRWVLAERSPLALPDARWDRMAYGIRDCETFLRAVV